MMIIISMYTNLERRKRNFGRPKERWTDYIIFNWGQDRPLSFHLSFILMIIMMTFSLFRNVSFR
jgi:hypothetical protein